MSAEAGRWDPEQGGGRYFRSRGVVHHASLTEHPENPEHQRWLLDVLPFGAAWLSADEAALLADVLAKPAPTPEQVYQAWHGTEEPWGGCADRERIDRVMALYAGGEPR